MTTAICLKCGARKIGALVRCRSCGYEPKDEEDQAKSILITDHYLSVEDLENVSERIKSGQGVTFDDASVQSLVENIQVVEQDRHKLAWFTCGIVVALGVLLGLALITVSYLVGK